MTHDVDTERPYIIKIPDLMSPAECRAMIDRVESLKPEIAPINTLDGTRVNRKIRSNERVMFDEQALADDLLERIRPRASATIHGMSLVGVNERFRCLRYRPGTRFMPHTDGSFRRSESEWSCYSFLIYLNDEFEGGATTFLTEPEVEIKPQTGMGLLFQHPIVHEGSLVTSGTKYVCRSDLMYQLADGPAPAAKAV